MISSIFAECVTFWFLGQRHPYRSVSILVLRMETKVYHPAIHPIIMYPTTVDTVTAGGGDGSSSSSFIQYVFGSMSSFTIGRIMVSWVATWMFRVGSVTIGLVIIAGSILYIKQDNLLVRSMRSNVYICISK
jgi:hypothetical protein